MMADHLTPQQAFETFDHETQWEIDRIAKETYNTVVASHPQKETVVDYNTFTSMLSDRLKFYPIFHEHCLSQTRNNLDFILEIVAYRIRVASVWSIRVSVTEHTTEMFRSEGFRMIVMKRT